MSALERNAPCPCGSGKKYKKCCKGTEKDSAPAAAPPLPGLPADDLRAMQEAAAVLQSRQLKPLKDSAEQMARLFAQGAPLGTWRYPLEPLLKVMRAERHEPTRRDLWGKIARSLVTPAFARELEAAMLTLARAPSTPEPERRALWLSMLTLQLARRGGDFAPESVPFLESLFLVQSRELLEHREQEQLLTTLGTEAGHAVLSGAEWAYLHAHLADAARKLLRSKWWGTQAKATVRLHEELKQRVDDAFVERLAQRLERRAADPKLTPEARDWYRRLHLEALLAPLELIALAYLRDAPRMADSPEEQAQIAALKAASTWAEATLEPYRLQQEKAGDAASAALLARAQAYLRAHGPVQGA
ncbi:MULTISPECIES: SEC-C metal-binding domain-containing protein [Myxococcaceae]|uniref:SEC-C metal-binding domain-containing protein n=1 Tax=Myxococcaceae TaxID=31 RepID=UPI001E2B90DF|nr:MULTISPECIES: SEC-C metal-binding domain-containing protein [Myxococcaceae]